MKENTLPGYLLRQERIRQGKGQKEVCYGICVTSYLSKIERGQVRPDVDILTALFARLGITYEGREEMLAPYRDWIEEYYERMLYLRPLEEVYQHLKGQGEMLAYSGLTLDWQVIRELQKWFAGERDQLDLTSLAMMAECMDHRQLACLRILQAHEEQEKDRAVELARQACSLWENSLTMLTLCYCYLYQSNYTAIHQMEQRMTAVALEEGNTYQLADYYYVKGSAYACLGMEELMMTYYLRCIHMLRDTMWEKELDGVYYNIGATCLEYGKYEEALHWLRKTAENGEDFMTLHKLALANIRAGHVIEGQVLLDRMKEQLDNDPCSLRADYLRYEEACMECQPDYMDDPKYLVLLEEMIEEMKHSYHFGHLYSYRSQIVEAYKRQRRYKSALEFEEMISETMVKNSV